MAALATVAELESHLQRDVADPVSAELALAGASGSVRAYCGWNLSQESTTFHLRGNDSQILTLPTLRLTSVSAVRVDTVATVAFNWDRAGQLDRHWQPWSRREVVEVDATHGYAPLPDVLRLVTLDLATRALSNPEALISATVGPVSRTYATGAANSGVLLSPLHMRLLDHYKL